MGKRIDIGIDGGGTGCRVVVLADGREAGATGGPANVVSDPEAAKAAIVATLAEALTALTLPPEALQHARIVAGLAGCRLPGIADAFAMELPFLAQVVDDSVTALEGAFDGGHGTLVNLGTGSFFIRRDARGLTHHGGWGLQLSDAGSAAWLGRCALSEMMEIEEDAGSERRGDPLIETLTAACGMHPVLFARNASASDFAALTPLILQQKSPLSRDLEARIGTELKRALKRLRHPDGAPWVLAGGLGVAMIDRLDASLRAGVRTPDGTALEGALAMARALP